MRMPSLDDVYDFIDRYIIIVSMTALTVGLITLVIFLIAIFTGNVESSHCCTCNLAAGHYAYDLLWRA